MYGRGQRDSMYLGNGEQRACDGMMSVLGRVSGEDEFQTSLSRGHRVMVPPLRCAVRSLQA